MDFGQFLQKQAQNIDERLDLIFKEYLKQMGVIHPKLQSLFQEFVKSTSGGKRIRGALVLLGYQINGGTDLGKVMDAALSFEIFQTAILAQDDVIDESPTRRSKPSLYNALGADHKAISETICLSDLGFFLSFKLLSELDIEDSLKLKAINLFSQSLSETVLGEMLDIEVPVLRHDISEEDVIKISLLKTARYTISGPLILGAVLAGAPKEALAKLMKFGDNLGIAFQIQDDILGIFGEEKITGKSASSDIKERKATTLIAFAQKKGSKEQKKVLEQFYGDKNISEEGINEIRDAFIRSGALDYARSRVDRYLQLAGKASKNDESLNSIIEFIRNRKS